jgi:hypothetical protein
MTDMPDMQTETAKGQADTPKGPRFTKVYERGWDRIGQLVTLKGGPTVAKLWVFLARHCGHDNALVCTLDTLAENLDCSEKSVRRATKYLEENGAIVIGKMGTANMYILNDAEVWKTYEDHKRFCSFRTRTLVSKKHNPDLKRRLTHMVGQPELFETEGS